MVSFHVTHNVELHVRIDNALDEQYQEVLGYTALSRNATGGIEAHVVMRRRSFSGCLRLRCVVSGQPPQRIVSTAPSITELLYALGLGDRVVGVDRFSRYPPEAQRKPKIGDYAESQSGGDRVAASGSGDHSRPIRCSWRRGWRCCV